MKHDQISRRDIPAIFNRHFFVSKAVDYPTGDFMVPSVNGKYIINNSDRPIFVCTTEGYIYKILPLDEGSREGLLRQLYFSYGVASEYESGGSSPSTRRLYSLEPAPVFFNKHKAYANHTRFHDFHEFTLPETYAETKWFTEKLDATSTQDDHLYAQIEKDVFSKANKIDAKNGLTYGLRHDEKKVWVMQPLFCEEKRYGESFSRISKAGIHNHVGRLERDTELFKANFILANDDRDFTNAEDLIANRIPTLAFNEVSIKNLSNSIQGYYMPEYGFTLSDNEELRNKALAFTDVDSDAYMPRTGIRIVIPGRVGRKGYVYARMGKYVSRIRTTGENTSGSALVYGHSATGEEELIGTTPLSKILTDGIEVKLPDGEHWNIPFFEDHIDAINYNDPDIQLRIDKVKEENSRLEKELKAMAKEKEKLTQEKDKKWFGLWGLLTKNPNIASFIIGLVTTAVVTVFKLVTEKTA